MEQEISAALLPGPGGAVHLTPCTALLAWGSCRRAGSQVKRHATPVCVIPSAVGRDGRHVPEEAREEHTSAASPEEWGAEQLLPERDRGQEGHETTEQ